jgi:methylmalonyl-CoA/ethylmalonyl-CoA epimerase
MRFDHAGIATDDLEGTVELFTGLFGAELVHEEEFDGMRVGFLDLGNGYFELLEPLEGGGAIAQFLEKRGSGIHHLAVETDDAAAAVDAAREMGIEPIDDDPRPGAWGHDVAFLHPRDTGGVLVEFVEH